MSNKGLYNVRCNEFVKGLWEILSIFFSTTRRMFWPLQNVITRFLEGNGHFPRLSWYTDLDGGTKVWKSFCGLLEFLPLNTSKAPGSIFLECLEGNQPSEERKNGRFDVHCCRLGPCFLCCWLDEGLYEVKKHFFLHMEQVNISHGLLVTRFWNFLWWVIAWFTFQKSGDKVNHSAQGNCYSCNQIHSFGFWWHFTILNGTIDFVNVVCFQSTVNLKGLWIRCVSPNDVLVGLILALMMVAKSLHARLARYSLASSSWVGVGFRAREQKWMWSSRPWPLSTCQMALIEFWICVAPKIEKGVLVVISLADCGKSVSGWFSTPQFTQQLHISGGIVFIVFQKFVQNVINFRWGN